MAPRLLAANLGSSLRKINSLPQKQYNKQSNNRKHRPTGEEETEREDAGQAEALNRYCGKETFHYSDLEL